MKRFPFLSTMIISLLMSPSFAGYLYCVTKPVTPEKIVFFKPPGHSISVSYYNDNAYEGEYAQLSQSALLAEKEWLGVINTYHGTPYLETTTSSANYINKLIYHYRKVGQLKFWDNKNSSYYQGKRCVTTYPVKEGIPPSCTSIEISRNNQGDVQLNSSNAYQQFCATLLEICQQSPGIKGIKKVYGVASVDSGKYNPSTIRVLFKDGAQVISQLCRDGG